MLTRLFLIAFCVSVVIPFGTGCGRRRQECCKPEVCYAPPPPPPAMYCDPCR